MCIKTFGLAIPAAEPSGKERGVMIMIIVSLILAIVVASAMLLSHNAEQARLMEPRSSIITMGIQIICGNCAGDADRPERTYLDRDGNCSQCGGHSYVLASSLYAGSASYRTGNILQPELVNAKVLPFNSQRRERIA
jgi:cbb3-type cytochrome oxidase cytochrome c subunit